MTIERALADLAFEAVVVEWRGPAPFVFAAVPAALVAELRQTVRLASYGWGVAPVAAEANGIAFRTSLFPRDGGYLVPLKAAVRRAGGIAPGDRVALRLRVEPRGR